MDPFSQLIKRFREVFAQLAPWQKLSVAVAVIVTLTTIGFVVVFTGHKEYAVLYSNLSSEDAGNIVNKLREKKVPYRLAEGGRIEIPTDKIAELRLELATAGLPQGGGVGFEIFDKKALGATDFEQQLNYRRALQGELARTINSLDEVLSSRVHIALPRESVFIEAQKKPTASVTLRLKPGKTLRPLQIEGISHLVASSVEGMKPEDVIIVDSNGNILSKLYDDSRLAKLSLTQSEYQRSIEMGLMKNIQTMLENVVGRDKAVVRVAADINFKVVEKTEETFDADNPSVRSTQKQAERNISSGTGNGGEKEKTSEIFNYELSKVVSKTIFPIGDIQKLSVAVLVDGRYTKNDKGEEKYQPLEKEEIESLRELVIKSAGINLARGDQVTVTNLPFKRLPSELDALPAAPPWYEQAVPYYPLLKYVFVLLAIVFIGLFLIRPLIRAVIRVAEGRIPPEQLTAPVTAEISDLARERALTGGMPMLAERELSDVNLVRKLASEDSDKFANILRNWLK